jgi:two-component system chemotaxis sensor kinase CheA
LSAIRLTGEDPRVDAEFYQPLFQVLVHLFRNAVDHGIEPPALRIAHGKPAVADIQCQLQRCEQGLQLLIRDNGRGLLLEKVRQKAVALQLVGQSESQQLSPAELAQFVFADALSTKDDVSVLSGRGIGLSAVRQQLSQFGGRIEVDSVAGQGCTFRIWLPIRPEVMQFVATEN